MQLETLKSMALAQTLTGVFAGITNEDYHAGPGYSNTTLGEAERSARHLHHYLNTPRETTKAKWTGARFHELMLEPHVVSGQWVISEAGVNFGTIAYKKIQAANPGKTCIPLDVYENLLLMREQCLLNPTVALALQEGIKELSGYVVCPDTGLLRKSRPDLFWPQRRMILDFKKTQDASPVEFGKSVANFAYYRQAPFHMDTFNLAYRQQAIIQGQPDPGDVADSVVFISVEEEAPHGVALYAVPHDAMEFGRLKYHSLLAAIRKIHVDGVYSGYPQEIQTLTVPQWLYFQ